MNRTIGNRVKWSIVIAGIAGVLSFGASRAYAANEVLEGCPGSSIGACVSTEQCQGWCTDLYPGSTGVCSQPSGCCFCFQ